MLIICTLLQTDNHASSTSLNFYWLDALPDAQTTVLKGQNFQQGHHQQLEIGNFVIFDLCLVDLRNYIRYEHVWLVEVMCDLLQSVVTVNFDL